MLAGVSKCTLCFFCLVEYAQIRTPPELTILALRQPYIYAPCLWFKRYNSNQIKVEKSLEAINFFSLRVCWVSFRLSSLSGGGKRRLESPNWTKNFKFLWVMMNKSNRMDIFNGSSRTSFWSSQANISYISCWEEANSNCITDFPLILYI